jgi:hypothetical protein
MDQKSSKLEYGNEGGMKTGIQIEDDNIKSKMDWEKYLGLSNKTKLFKI